MSLRSRMECGGKWETVRLHLGGEVEAQQVQGAGRPHLNFRNTRCGLSRAGKDWGVPAAAGTRRS